LECCFFKEIIKFWELIMINRLQQFIADVKFEMTKVSWPSWEELRSSTYIVLGLSLILIVFLFSIDFLLSKILNIVL
jgi:preprotein translocase subunit SecE